MKRSYVSLLLVLALSLLLAACGSVSDGTVGVSPAPIMATPALPVESAEVSMAPYPATPPSRVPTPRRSPTAAPRPRPEPCSKRIEPPRPGRLNVFPVAIAAMLYYNRSILIWEAVP